MDIIKRVSLKYLPSFLVCLARNTDYKNNYGKCGPDYGRCNSYHNERFLYCDLATNECHDSEVKKNLQANPTTIAAAAASHTDQPGKS